MGTYFNRSQKRVRMMKNELQMLHTDHLNTFIEGVAAIEPPRYQYVKGVIQPPLTLVKLKDGANVFDLGNIYYPRESKIRHVRILVENGNRKLEKSDPLPSDDSNLLCIPIQHFVAQELFGLWRAKFQALTEHRDNINGLRQYAYGILKQPVRLSLNGKALSTPNSQYPDFDGSNSNASNSRKRANGEPVLQHACNKRSRVGLDSIPDSAKAKSLNSLSDQLKIDLFNAVVRTAFPSFDDVMMAAWNVVSIYENVGSEFAELHRSVVELKSVLEEFEGSCCDMKTVKMNGGKDQGRDEGPKEGARTPGSSAPQSGMPPKKASQIDPNSVSEILEKSGEENGASQQKSSPALDSSKSITETPQARTDTSRHGTPQEHSRQSSTSDKTGQSSADSINVEKRRSPKSEAPNKIFEQKVPTNRGGRGGSSSTPKDSRQLFVPEKQPITGVLVDLLDDQGADNSSPTPIRNADTRNNDLNRLDWNLAAFGCSKLGPPKLSLSNGNGIIPKPPMGPKPRSDNGNNNYNYRRH
ncbi:hypothetical protein CC78DRAFT_617265 [Lojkania enalia]|uniref:Uncharacterized protein n=1 Tax=Lojkania enalia TaxID=147567 RepID=A0A9P4N2Z0_9PLEO|nr:hypothetical protein CC78DRAFT_617265 [Didymosphaeria enalia]